jgi:hypothetical protein
MVAENVTRAPHTGVLKASSHGSKAVTFGLNTRPGALGTSSVGVARGAMAPSIRVTVEFHSGTTVKGVTGDWVQTIPIMVE